MDILLQNIESEDAYKIHICVKMNHKFNFKYFSILQYIEKDMNFKAIYHYIYTENNYKKIIDTIYRKSNITIYLNIVEECDITNNNIQACFTHKDGTVSDWIEI